ncbi:MAG TPA: CPXCG motif-containing cysteine-rich protein [Planctomycetota bacterium]|nr:CPXCG motif-containing cysteine-rich protein [Planctomycetota bacterium]
MGDLIEVTCPYCGEPSSLVLEEEEEEAEFVQDCPVCCRPWTVRVRARRDGSFDVSVGAENE